MPSVWWVSTLDEGEDSAIPNRRAHGLARRP